MLLMVKLCQGNTTREVTTTETVLSLFSLTTPQTESQTTPGVNTTQTKTSWTTPLNYSISTQEMTSTTIIYPEITQIIEKL